MITIFTNRTGTDEFPSVPTTRRPARRARRAAEPGGCTAVPGRRTARRCPRRPEVISWLARRRTGRSVECPGRQLSTTGASSTTAASSTIMGWRPETRPGTHSPACRVPPSLRRRPRRHPRCRPRRRSTCSTRSSSTSSDGR